MRKGGIYCKAFLAILLVASFASFAYSVPISPNVMAGYYENSQVIPRYRVSFLNDSWTTELSATTLDTGSDIEWAVLKCDRNQTNCIFGTLDDEGEVQAQGLKDGTWGSVQDVAPNIGTTNDQSRGFDVAFENARGWGLVISGNNTNKPYYDIWYPTNNTWSGVQQFPASACGASGTPAWVEAASKPNSNEILMAYMDSAGDYCGYVWDGSSWGNAKSIYNRTFNETQKTLCVNYEQSSGRGVVFWEEEGSNVGLKHANWTGSSWQVASLSCDPFPCVAGDKFVYFSCASMPGTNRIMFASPLLSALGGGGDSAGEPRLMFSSLASQLSAWIEGIRTLNVKKQPRKLSFTTYSLYAVEWNQGFGTAATFTTTVESDLTDRQLADVAYLGGSGTAMVVYAADTNFPNYRTCTSLANCQAGTWGSASATTASACGATGGQVDLVHLIPNTATNDTMLAYSTQDANEPICSQLYNSSIATWGAPATFEDSSRFLPNARPFDVFYFNDSRAPQISFISPTPSNASSSSNNYTYLNVSSVDSNEHSTFTDWSGDLLGWWSFDFYNSTVVLDNSTYRNNATFQGAGFGTGSLLQGRRGYAARFDGVNDYLNTSLTANITGAYGNLTVAFWIYTGIAIGGFATNTRFIAKSDAKSSGFLLAIDQANKVIPFYVTKDWQNYSATVRGGSDALSNHTWYHLVYTWQNGKHPSVFKNGINTTQQNVGAQAMQTNNNNLQIGRRQDDWAYFGAILDELMIWNRTFTATEALALFNATSNSSQSNKYENNFTLLNPGTYTAKAWSIDYAGNANNTGLYTFTVAAANAAPAFQWAAVNLTNGSTYNLSKTVRFFANFTDDSGVTSVIMTFNSTNYTMAQWNGTDNTSITLNYNLTGLTAGTHTYLFTASDGTLANSSQTFSLFIAQNNASNVSFKPPTPENGTTQTSTNNSIYVNVSSGDSDSPPGHSAFVDWNYSLVGWWSFDSYNSTVVYDNSTYRQNATMSNTNTSTKNITDGARGNGFKFFNPGTNGAQPYISLGNRKTYPATHNLSSGGWSIAFWWKPYTVAGTHYIVSKRLNATTSYWVSSDGNGLLKLTFVVGNGENYNRTASVNLVNDTWSHLAFTWNGTNSTIKINGVDKSGPTSTGLSQETSESDLMFGATGGWAGANGTVDEIMVFNRSISNAEILALYNASANQYVNNFTSLSASSDYYFRGWSIDDVGNVNSTETRMISVLSANAAPQFWWASTNFTNGSEYGSPKTIQFFANWTDDNGTQAAILNFAGTNYTMAVWNGTVNTSRVFNVNLSIAQIGNVGNKTYFFNAFDGALANQSQNFTFNIVQNTTYTLTHTLNGSASDLVGNYPATVAVACTYSGITDIEFPPTVREFRNGTAVKEGSAISYSETPFAASWNWTCLHLPTTNYASKIITLFSNISLGSVNVSLWLNGTNNDVFYTSGETVNASARRNTTGEGNLTLYRNTTGVAFGVDLAEEANQSMSTSTFNYTACYPASQNYSSSCATFFANPPTNTQPAFQWAVANLTNGSVYNLSQTVRFFANFTDDVGVTSVIMTVNSTNYTMAIWNGTDNTSATFNYNLTGLTAGTHTYLFTASDGSLANSSQTFSLFIAANNESNVSFVSPTPNNASTITDNYIYANVSSADSDSTSGHSVFLDWNYSLVGWWSFDSYNSTGIYDNSTYGNNATFTGTDFNTSNLTVGKRGLGLKFDGGTDYLVLGNKASLNLGNVLTFEAWINPANLSGRQTILGNNNGASAWQVEIGNGGVGKLSVIVTGVWIAETSNNPIVAGQWQHIAYTRNGTGTGTNTLYVNGNPQSLSTNAGNNFADTTNNKEIGRRASNSQQFGGVIDDVRIFSRSLSAAEINATFNASAYQYARNFTSLSNGSYYARAWSVDDVGNVNSTELRQWDVTHGTPNVSFVSPTPANASSTSNNWINVSVNSSANSSTHSVYTDWNNSLLGWWSFDFTNGSDIYDNSSYANNATFVNGINQSNLVEGMRGLALDFDGSNDRLNTSIYDNLRLISAGLTIMLWFKTGAAGGAGNDRILSKGINSTDSFMLTLNGGTGNALGWMLATGGTNYNRTSSVSFNNNTWYHVAVVWNGTNSSMFINGIGRSGSTAGGLTQTTAFTPFIIGDAPTGGAPFNGTLDEIQIYNRTLTIAEINASYDAKAYQYYNNFTGLTVPATYTSQAWVIDREGAFNTTGLYTFNTISGVPAFQWAIANLTNGSTYNLSQTVRFFANFTDDVGVTSVIMTFNSTNYTMAVWNGTDNTSATFNYNLTGLTAGTHTYLFTASDGSFANSSQTFSLVIASNNVSNVSFKPPTPENGTTQTSTNNSIYVNVSSRDSDSPSGYSVFNDWNYSLVGWWAMDYYNSTVVYDNSTYRNNATFTGGGLNAQNITPGIRGKSLYFGVNLSGGSWYLNAGTRASLQVIGNQTIMMWVYPTDYGVRRNPWGKAYGGEGTITHEMSGGLNYYWGVGGGNNNTYQSLGSSSALPKNTWTHIAVVRNLTANATQNGTVRWYINGVSNSSAYATYSQAVASPLNMYIGYAYTNSYTGNIDEVMYFNRSLTAAEMLAIYNASANQYTRNFTSLSNGDYYFKAWSIDDVGNVNSTENRLVSVSNSPPAFKWQLVNITNNSNYGQQTLAFFANFSDDDGVSTVTLTLRHPNATVSNYTMSSYNGSSTNGVWNYNLSLPISAGTFNYNFTASDGTLANTSQDYTLVLTNGANIGIAVYYQPLLDLNPTVEFRNWTAGWGVQATAVTMADIADDAQWVRVECSPLENACLMAALSDTGKVDAAIWRNNSWSSLQNIVSSIGTTNDNYRGFDVAFERIRGWGIVVTQNNSNTPYYRIWYPNNNTWSGVEAFQVNDTCAGTPVWLEANAKPYSDEILVTYLDNASDACSYVWNGTQFGSPVRHAAVAATTASKIFCNAYEQLSGDAIVMFGNESGAVYQQNHYVNNDTWSSGKQLGAGSINTMNWFECASNPSSNSMMFAISYISSLASPSYQLVNAQEWDGSAWGTNANLDADGSRIASNLKALDVAYLGGDGGAMVAYASKYNNSVSERRCANALDCNEGIWATGRNTTSLICGTGNSAGVQSDSMNVRLVPDRFSNDAMLLYQTNHTLQPICGQHYNASSDFWSPLQLFISSDSALPAATNFDFDFNMSSNVNNASIECRDIRAGEALSITQNVTLPSGSGRGVCYNFIGGSSTLSCSKSPAASIIDGTASSIGIFGVGRNSVTVSACNTYLFGTHVKFDNTTGTMSSQKSYFGVNGINLSYGKPEQGTFNATTTTITNMSYGLTLTGLNMSRFITTGINSTARPITFSSNAHNNTFYNTTIINATSAIVAANANNLTFVEMTISQTGVNNDLTLTNSLDNYFLSTNVTPSKTYLLTANYTSAYYAVTEVTYCENSSAFSGANVSIYNNSIFFDSALTGSNGLTSQRNVTSFIEYYNVDTDQEVTVNYTPHTFYANGSNMVNDTMSVHVSQNRTQQSFVAMCLNMNAILDLSLVNASVNFSAVSVGSDYYSYNASGVTYRQFIMQNDGNTAMNVTITATSLFTGNDTSMPASWYQFNASDYESGSLTQSCPAPFSSYSTFYRLNSTGQSGVPYGVCNLGNDDLSDAAQIAIHIQVPTDEPAGAKTSTVTFTASQA